MWSANLISERIQNIATSADPYRFYSRPVPEGTGWELTRVTVENQTNNATKFRIAIEHHGDLLYQAEQLSPVADSLYTDADPLLLQEGDRLAVEYVGHTSGDVLVLTYQGRQLRGG